MRSASIYNHHGISNPHLPLQDKGPNQSLLTDIVVNTSPLTFTVSLGLGGDVFVAQHSHNTNHIK
jgi:hypothetical protein